ncbi:hypothetical protein Ppa06_63450 [Planomonospora parontospora subsp. parontospora]|uniref:Uncharacterized protein n=2 Tax=Planomonospora parontospora TaxID=58119 RepID=A0AA37BP04_9ACTN|nr:hypothetical protein [Planomonospora parontospora]GGK97609.1 hypothetical protein GCM10010126_66300 [Planomonospora parontospora]GII12547.1 hypothetical protein Ppa06_63450 [Planomonospora parontospora subsp. parontospora]
MAKLISALTDDAAIKNFLGVVSALTEADAKIAGSYWDVEPGPGEWIKVGLDVVRLDSGWDADVYVRYELWDGRPLSSQDDGWDDNWTGAISFTSGQVTALSASLDGEDTYNEIFDLGRGESTWEVCVQRKRLENDREPDFPRHIYRIDLFRLRFWPPENPWLHTPHNENGLPTPSQR